MFLANLFSEVIAVQYWIYTETGVQKYISTLMTSNSLWSCILATNNSVCHHIKLPLVWIFFKINIFLNEKKKMRSFKNTIDCPDTGTLTSIRETLWRLLQKIVPKMGLFSELVSYLFNYLLSSRYIKITTFVYNTIYKEKERIFAINVYNILSIIESKL